MASRKANRTVRQVARGSSSSSGKTGGISNTALAVGAGALAVGAILLFSGTAKAAEPVPPTPTPPVPVPPLPPTPATPPRPPPAVVAQQTAVSAAEAAAYAALGVPLLYKGPGTYRVTAPSGLAIRSVANAAASLLGRYPRGTLFEVVDSVEQNAATLAGWVQVASPANGFACMSCKEGGAGAPFLQKVETPANA